MQRKQLEKLYGVSIYQVSGGSYVVELPDGKKTFRYMADVEDYLIRKYGKKNKKDEEENKIEYKLYKDDKLLIVGTVQELADYLCVTAGAIYAHVSRTYKRKDKKGFRVFIKEEERKKWN